MENGTRWVEANGVVSRIALSGAGESLLVMIHEMGGTLESWEPVVGALGRSRRILRYDVRGAGLSQKVRGTLSVEALADDLAALLDAVQAPGKVAVMGCAVGAAIAIQFAASYRDRCSALIATSPATGVKPERRAALLARADAVECEGSAANLDERMARSYPQVLRTDPVRYAQVRASRAAADPFGVAAASRMLAGLDMTATLRAIACPSLVLAGTYDGDRPPEGVAEVAAQISGAICKVLPTGHFMALQTPELLNREIEDFLTHHTGT
jgi:pimeloyl-ACP methyl ester carboxylesterase